MSSDFLMVGVNTIIENLIEQVDEHGWDSGLLDIIESVRYNKDAMSQGEDALTNMKGVQKRNITTKRCDNQDK